jgi:hypothetical protein
MLYIDQQLDSLLYFYLFLGRHTRLLSLERPLTERRILVEIVRAIGEYTGKSVRKEENEICLPANKRESIEMEQKIKNERKSEERKRKKNNGRRIDVYIR